MDTNEIDPAVQRDVLAIMHDHGITLAQRRLAALRAFVADANVAKAYPTVERYRQAVLNRIDRPDDYE